MLKYVNVSHKHFNLKRQQATCCVDQNVAVGQNVDQHHEMLNITELRSRPLSESVVSFPKRFVAAVTLPIGNNN